MDSAQTPSPCPESAVRAVTRKHSFAKAKDGRGREIRGLWIRNGRFYARLLVEDAKTGRSICRRIQLDAKTVSEASSKLQDLKRDRRHGCLRSFTASPSLEEFVETYFQLATGKRPGTTYRERSSLTIWKRFLGPVRLSKITKRQIHAFVAARLREGVSSRTVNLDLNTLHVMFKKARDLDLVHQLPTAGIKRLTYVPKRRPLLTLAEIQALCEAARGTRNDEQFRDYVLFLTFSGARVNEALRLRWPDIDLANGTLTIGRDGETKNYEARVLNFNQELERHLRAMHARRAPDTDWLFPSPRRGDSDSRATSFKGTFELARTKLKVTARFHDLRHYFISQCVMAGIDYMTIARWVGHKDGGVLIGRVYGHLNDEHARKQAGRVDFT